MGITYTFSFFIKRKGRKKMQILDTISKNFPPELMNYLNFLIYYKIEFLLALIFILLLILIISLFNQKERYERLKKWIIKHRDEMKRQEEIMKEIEEKVEKYEKSQEGMGYWLRIKEEIGELSKLPSLSEEDNQLVLKIQISNLKKDKTDVTATSREIKINIYEGDMPLKCSYFLSKNIDPSRLTITYKGNTLEIRAPKV